MPASKHLQKFILFLGDLVIFYLGLFLTLAIRYQTSFSSKIWQIHQAPFFFVYLFWVLIFYISGLYDLKKFYSLKAGFGQTAKAMVISLMIAILIFYAVPSFKITPKTNLIINGVIAGFLVLFWRKAFWNLASKASKIKILFFGYSDEAKTLINSFKTHPHLGYEVAAIMARPVEGDLKEIIKQNNVQLIVASREIMNDANASKHLYQALLSGTSIKELSDFYEEIMEKIPVSIITETWFLDNLFEINKRAFRFFKRIFDVIFSIILGSITLILILPIFGLGIKLEDRGPVFLRQKREGKNGKIFKLMKFRSMRALNPDGSAEQQGAKWVEDNDKRITKIGGFMRKTRIDELPQLWNILKGELSFIGPRPERPEFVESLEKEIPHYAMRHLVKPGLSGWAQIKLPHGGAGEESMEKLQYDLYYIKNRSFTLDLAIALKTLATLLKFEGR
ncbi:MAG: sugar transferase [Patescibacteria group bacterium]